MGAGMPLEATTSITAVLVVICAICLFFRLRSDYIKHIPTASGIISAFLAILAFLAFLAGFICSCIRGKRKLMTHVSEDSIDDKKFLHVDKEPEVYIMKASPFTT